MVCDLDNRCFREFRQDLSNCLEKSAIQSPIYFCIAVEEGEAWYLGDINARKIAYPQAKRGASHLCNEHKYLVEK